MGIYDNINKKATGYTPGTIGRGVGALGAGLDAANTYDSVVQGDYKGAVYNAIKTGASATSAYPTPAAIPAAALRAGMAIGDAVIPSVADAVYGSTLANTQSKDEVYNMYLSAKTPMEMRNIYNQRLAAQQQQQAAEAERVRQQQLLAQQRTASITEARTLPTYVQQAFTQQAQLPQLQQVPVYQPQAIDVQRLYNDPTAAAGQKQLLNISNSVGGAGGLLLAVNATKLAQNVGKNNVAQAVAQDRINAGQIANQSAGVQANNNVLQQNFNNQQQQINTGIQQASGLYSAQQNANAVANNLARQYENSDIAKSFLQAKESGDYTRAQNIADAIAVREGKVPQTEFKPVTIKNDKGLETTQIFNSATGQVTPIKQLPVYNADGTVTIPGQANPMPRAQFERIKSQLGY